jgi:flagellar assembly protein FliH
MRSSQDNKVMLGNLKKTTSLTDQRVTLGPATSLAISPMAEPVIDLAAELEKLRRDLAQAQQEICGNNEKLNTATAELISVQDELAQARNEVQQLRADLKQEHDGAREKGYQAGIESALQESLKSLEQQSALWWKGLEQLIEHEQIFFGTIKSQMTDLIMAAVAKIIGEQLADPHAIAASIDQIIRESGELHEIQVFIAPTHYEALQTGGTTLRPIRGRTVELFPDTRVEYGGCLLEGRNGVIDGRFEIQLEKLRSIVQSGIGS